MDQVTVFVPQHLSSCRVCFLLGGPPKRLQRTDFTRLLVTVDLASVLKKGRRLSSIPLVALYSLLILESLYALGSSAEWRMMRSRSAAAAGDKIILRFMAVKNEQCSMFIEEADHKERRKRKCRLIKQTWVQRGLILLVQNTSKFKQSQPNSNESFTRSFNSWSIEFLCNNDKLKNKLIGMKNCMCLIRSQKIDRTNMNQVLCAQQHKEFQYDLCKIYYYRPLVNKNP